MTWRSMTLRRHRPLEPLPGPYRPMPPAQPSGPGPHWPALPGHAAQPGPPPAPRFPAPHFPAQPRSRSHRNAWLAVAGMLTMIASAIIVVVASLPGVSARPVADPSPTQSQQVEVDTGAPNTSPDGTFEGAAMVEQLNAALAVRDRAAFFTFVEGDAVEPLSLWWDNMDVLGWSEGAFSLGPADHDYADDTAELMVTLGAVTAGSPQIPEEMDHPDAGTSYAQSNRYQATIRVTDDGANGVITDWDVYDSAAPWDLEPLYAVIGEHGVAAGYEREKAVVDELADVTEESAEWVIDQYSRETGNASAQRFLAFYTFDAEVFNDWFLSGYGGNEWSEDSRAGTMFDQWRPYPAPGLPEDIAVSANGQQSAGGVLTVGPLGLRYGLEDAQATVVHEFTHAIHFTDVPESSWPGSAVTEGWAVYNEGLFTGEGTFGAPGTQYRTTISGCLEPGTFTGRFPDEESFYAYDSALCAYALSGSMYAYAASLGNDVYALADEALRTGEDLPTTIRESGGTPIEEGGWQEWLEETF